MKVPPLPGAVHRRTLDNGLRVLVLENRQAPIVATALTYTVGARDDPPGAAGRAHFLEHMMFKGSKRYAAGEIDAATQRLGGEANALTGHDATLYYFQFASDRWREALAIEADRMAGLRLDRSEVERERGVILEEIAMAADDPWQSLEEEVYAAFFNGHPYGRPILGTAAELEGIAPEQLRAAHDAHGGPTGAVLTVAGDVGIEALDQVAAAFDGVSRRGADKPPVAPRVPSPVARRLEVRRGVLPRWLAALACPAPDAAEHIAVRMAVAALGLGRTSRLYRELVDRDAILTAVSCSVLDTLDTGCVTVTAEPGPGVTLDELEERVWATIASLVDRPPTADELERLRHLVVADWMFSHETIVEQALTASFWEACVDLEFPRRQIEAIMAVGAEEVVAAAASWLSVERDLVIGRCLPEESA